MICGTGEFTDISAAVFRFDLKIRNYGRGKSFVFGFFCISAGHIVIFAVKVTVKVPKFNPKKQNVLPIKISDMPDTKKGKVSLTLKPGETVVLIIHELL